MRRFAVAIMATSHEGNRTTYNARVYVIDADSSAEALGKGVILRNKEDGMSIFTYAVTEILTSSQEKQKEIEDEQRSIG
jgi:hypothetical protein